MARKLGMCGRLAAGAAPVLLLISCVDSLTGSDARNERPVISQHPEDYIRPYENNPSYWQYKGAPLILVGGSEEAVLFNYAGRSDQLASFTSRGDRGPESVTAQLDRLAAHGGNYIRNTISWLKPDHGNVYPFLEEDGRFDLERFNPEFWNRFEHLLEEAYERDVIVHLELFDPFDYYRDLERERGWSDNPFNPANNVNYGPEESGLPTDVTARTREFPHPIFRTAPGMGAHQDGIVLTHQEALFDRMLEISLGFPNVLYTIYNEGYEPHQPKEFADHWAAFIHERAAQRGVPVFVGLMPFERDPDHATYRAVYDDPERYQFVDISQNNRLHRGGEQVHWEHIMRARHHVAGDPRPLTSVKIYGFGERDSSSPDHNPAHSWTGGTDHAVDRHFRNLIGGVASSRFHRWRAGLGLTVHAEHVLTSSRMLIDAIDLVSCDPDPHFSLFESRSENQVYGCFTGTDYAVYAAEAGSFEMLLAQGAYEVQWLDVMHAAWSERETVTASGPSSPVTLEAPGARHVALITRR